MSFPSAHFCEGLIHTDSHYVVIYMCFFDHISVRYRGQGDRLRCGSRRCGPHRSLVDGPRPDAGGGALGRHPTGVAGHDHGGERVVHVAVDPEEHRPSGDHHLGLPHGAGHLHLPGEDGGGGFLWRSGG